MAIIPSVMYHCLLGMQCSDFAIVAADQMNTQGIIIMKDDENKLHRISDRLMLAVIGDSGDSTQFAQFVAKNYQLYKMRNQYGLGTAAAVHFTRKNLSDALRSQTPSMVNMLIAGYDDQDGGKLFYLDFLASCIEVPFAVHGLGGTLSLGILDAYHNKNLTVDEAYEVLKLCVRNIHERLIFGLPNFHVEVVDKNGIRELPVINVATFVNK